MAVTGLGPIVALGFLAGLTTSAVLLRLGRLRSPRAALAAAALPFGCAMLPLAALIAASLAASWLR